MSYGFCDDGFIIRFGPEVISRVHHGPNSLEFGFRFGQINGEIREDIPGDVNCFDVASDACEPIRKCLLNARKIDAHCSDESDYNF